MDIQSEYIKSVEKLIDATNAGIVDWKKQNATTFYLKTESDDLNSNNLISIQLIEDGYSDQYIFQISNPKTKNIVVNLDSTNYYFRPSLVRLYQTVSLFIEQKNLKTFNDILGNILPQ